MKPEKNIGNIYSSLDATDARGIAGELEAASRRNGRCRKPGTHVVLSLGNGERLSDEQWRQVDELFRKQFGYDRAFMVRHGDTSHDHVHLIASRIKLNGRAVSSSYERLKLRQFCRNMEELFDLTRTPERSSRPRICKDELEKGERLHAQGKKQTLVPERLAIAATVKATLIQAPTLAEFEHRLLREHITTRWKYDEQGKPVGVSFGRGEACISGRHAGVSCKTLTLHYSPQGTSSHEQTHRTTITGGTAGLDGTTGRPRGGPTEGGNTVQHEGTGGGEGTTSRLGGDSVGLPGVATPIKEVGVLLCRAIDGLAVMFQQEATDSERFIDNAQRQAIRRRLSPKVRQPKPESR